jgi:hypothetical protein
MYALHDLGGLYVSFYRYSKSASYRYMLLICMMTGVRYKKESVDVLLLVSCEKLTTSAPARLLALQCDLLMRG